MDEDTRVLFVTCRGAGIEAGASNLIEGNPTYEVKGRRTHDANANANTNNATSINRGL